jgi:hypothetical protein
MTFSAAFSSVITIPAYCSGLSTVAISYSIMSDADSEANSISDLINAHSDQDDGDEDSSISPAVRELCNLLRVNDPRVLDYDSFLVPSPSISGYSKAEWIEVFQALKENTSVKCIRLSPHKFTKRSVETAAKYLESSQTLQTIRLSESIYSTVSSRYTRNMLCSLTRSLSQYICDETLSRY